MCAIKLICFDVECNIIRISLVFRCFLSYFFTQILIRLTCPVRHVKISLFFILFYRCIYYVYGPGIISVALLSMEGQIALRFHQKYLNLRSEDE